MIKAIINLENKISNLEDVDNILKKQNIKKLILEISGESSWERIEETILEEKKIYYNFLCYKNNMKIYNIIYAKFKENFNLSDVVSEIKLSNIALDQKEIKKYICCACICEFVRIGSSQRIEIENINQLKSPPKIVESVYLIENILCNIYGGSGAILSDRDITIGISSYMNEFWTEFILYSIDRMVDYYEMINTYQESLKSIKSIDEEIKKGIEQINKTKDNAEKDINNKLEEMFKNNVNSFYGRAMEIIGIFIAIFSLIGFNLFRDNYIDMNNILIMNFSCILAIVVMFFLIKHILDEKLESDIFILIIVALIVAILILACL